MTGGALIIVGEDYGEGSSIMQERSHAFAMKSQFWLLDPRPEPALDRQGGGATASSCREATNTPVMLMVRIRSCHVTGQFATRDNRPPPLTVRDALADAAPRFRPHRAAADVLCRTSRTRSKNRWPAAQRFIAEHGLNELFGPAEAPVGIVLQGGMYNGVIRALQRLGLADIYGDTRGAALRAERHLSAGRRTSSSAFCAGKDAVLVVEEGQPEFIEQQLAAHALPARTARWRCTARTCCRWPANIPGR